MYYMNIKCKYKPKGGIYHQLVIFELFINLMIRFGWWNRSITGCKVIERKKNEYDSCTFDKNMNNASKILFGTLSKCKFFQYCDSEK